MGHDRAECRLHCNSVDRLCPEQAGCSASGWTPQRLRGCFTCSTGRAWTATTSTKVRVSNCPCQRGCMLDRSGAGCLRAYDPSLQLHIFRAAVRGNCCPTPCLAHPQLSYARRRLPLRTTDQPLRGARRPRVSGTSSRSALASMHSNAAEFNHSQQVHPLPLGSVTWLPTLMPAGNPRRRLT